MLRRLFAIALPALLAVAVTHAPARAADALPIAGAWGDIEAKGCHDYKEETEGGYIVIDKDGRGWGSGGECGCKVKSVKKSGKAEYAIVASCQCLDGPKETRRRKLIVLSDSEIEWNGTKYQKCEPLP
ncbi:MAG TPA: hypothetical protein VLD66_00045 [Methyloceanibacter sp.]|jgi:hypothetical protein|nr:hypothetical protein [Methyloceanibacter sp.]